MSGERKEQEMDMYQCMWFCIAGSFLGYVIEMLWYRKLRGKWICRKGVIYGPYSPIYGIALVGFSKTFYKIKDKIFIFIWGSILGSTFEYLCGFLQEKILGTKSWDYSKKPFQLHGRICLEFAVYWGMIAVFVVGWITPGLSRVYGLIPPEIREELIGILFGFFVFDCGISGAACLQQRNRREGNIIKNRFTEFLDEHYPDERLEKIFTEIRIIPSRPTKRICGKI